MKKVIGYVGAALVGVAAGIGLCKCEKTNKYIDLGINSVKGMLPKKKEDKPEDTDFEEVDDKDNDK